MNVNYAGVPGALVGDRGLLIMLTLVLRRHGMLRPHDAPNRA